MTTRPTLEICVETLADAAAALSAGADRLEICSALALGGLTPSAGLVSHIVTDAHESGATVCAMVRPRDGDFAYDTADLTVARAEGEALIDQGVDGLVFGAAREGRLDHDAMRPWVTAMRDKRPDIGLTLHRAVDLLDDPVEAVEAAVELGFDHILTSGGVARAFDALPVIRAMVDRAAGRLTVMAGSGVRSGNVRAIMDQTGVIAIHASAGKPIGSPDTRAIALGFTVGARHGTCATEVAAIRAAISRR